MHNLTLSQCFFLSVEPGPPTLPLSKIPGSAHDTTVKSTVLDAHAHFCILASKALHVVKKKVNLRCDFSVL